VQSQTINIVSRENGEVSMSSERPTTNTTQQPSWLFYIGRLSFIVLFRVFPVVIFTLAIWTLLQAVSLQSSNQESASFFEDNQINAPATATALATQSSASHNDQNAVRLVQFATNTPDANAIPEATPTATQAEVVPTDALPSTPIPLPTFLRPPESDLVEIAGTAVPTQVPLISRDYELVNILLLGGDEEISQDNTIRTDTMIVVSINTETNTVSMLSFPRDLFVYVPTPTMQRLNTVYGIGEAFGWDGGGFGLLRQTIFYNFGINVHYYARVNFSGFETIIDRLGGVDIAVDCTYQDYYPVEDFDPDRSIEENYELRTLPVGYYTFNGFDALWYARTRRLSSDFDRGRRQQQLLRSIFSKALSENLLANLPTLWNEVTSVVETNIPFEVVVGLLPIALELDASRIENFTMIRTYHTTPWQNPDGQFVQLPEYEPIRQLLTDFYTPPTSSRIALANSPIAVYNGSSADDYDLVAVERLRTMGFNAYAMGEAPTTTSETQLIDQVGQSKGSLIESISAELNINISNITIEPVAERDADYVVIVGDNYNSCPGGVLPTDE
jgi:LCP family protein required for cell wall assembly